MLFLQCVLIISFLMQFVLQNVMANGQELRSAVTSNNLIEIQKILEKSPDSIESVDERGFTAFHCINTAKTCNFLIDWVKKNRPNKLIEYINKPNWGRPTETPLLHIVNIGGDYASDVIEPLLDAGADIYAKNNQSEGVFHLLRNIKKGKVLLSWIKRNNKDLTKLLEAKENGFTPIIHFLQCVEETEDNVAVFNFLLGAGANINAIDENGATIFHHWASCGKQKFGSALIDWIKVNQPEKLSQYLNVKDSEGETPLFYAIKTSVGEQALKTVELLLQNGAKADAINKNGQTLFHCVDAFSFSPIMAKALISIAKNKDYEEAVSKVVRVGDMFNCTPLYSAMEHDLDDLVTALEGCNAPLFLYDNKKQPIFPYANRNPKLLVKALLNALAARKNFTEQTKKTLFGDILLPSILFQHTECFPLIEKEKKKEDVLKLFDEYEPKRVCNFVRELIKEKTVKNSTHNIALLIDQDVEAGNEVGPVLASFNQALRSSSVPCLVFGEHILKKAFEGAAELGINIEKTIDFFSVNAKQPFSVYLVIPKAYSQRTVPDWENCKIEDPAWTAHLGLNSSFLSYIKFKDITFDEKHAYGDISRDEFGTSVVKIVAAILTVDPKNERIVFINGHGIGFESEGHEREPDIAGLPLHLFMDLTDVLEQRRTAFGLITTCFMAGANMSVFEKFINNDVFNSSIAHMIGIRNQKAHTDMFVPKPQGTKVFWASLAGADIASIGAFNVDSFFYAAETFLKLLQSDAHKDVVPKVYDWITRMLRVVGFQKNLNNYPQVRLPGKDNKFYVTNINGDLQVINALSIGKKDIHVTNKNLLITYLHDMTMPVILEQKLPVIVAAGTDCYVRFFENIDVQIPDVGIAAFLFEGFLKEQSDYATDMAHRETYLIKKLTFKTDDVLEDAILPAELEDKKITGIYNLLLTRGLEETPLVTFSLEENPNSAGFYSVSKDDDEIVIAKINDPAWIRAEVHAIMVGSDSAFEPDEILFLTKYNKFVEKNEKDLETVLPDMVRCIVTKSLVRNGQYLDRCLNACLHLMENKNTQMLIEKELPEILDRCKNLVPWMRFEKVRTVIRSFPKPNEDIKKRLETLVEELFKRRRQKHFGPGEPQKDMYDMLKDQLKKELEKLK